MDSTISGSVCQLAIIIPLHVIRIL